MSESQDTPPEETPEPQAQPAPAPEQKDADGSHKDDKKEQEPETGLPVSQILLGGASTTALSGFWVASAFGPWAAAGVGATAVATGGAAYVAHRRRKKGQSGMRRESTTVRKSSGGTSGLGKTSGLGGGKSAGGASPAGKSGRPSKGSGGSSKGSGGSSRGSGKGGGSLNPFSRKAAGRGSGGGPSGGSTSQRKGRKHSTPPGDGGMPDPKARTKSGRWGRSGGTAGGSNGDSTKKGGGMGSSSRGASGGRGRFARAAGRLGRWADTKTGKRASAAWKAASGAKGFRARRQAARQALRSKSGRPMVNGGFAIIGAILAGLWSLGSRGRAAWHARADAALNQVDPNARQEHAAHSGPPGGEEIPHQDDIEREPVVTDSTLPPQYTDAPTHQDGAATGGATATSTGGTMAGLPHAQIATDMLSAAGRYEPADAYTVVREAKQWPEVSRDVAMSVRAYAQQLENSRFPLDQACLSKLQEYYNALSQTVSLAEEIEPLLRKAHQVDLERQEAPRGDESKWNV